MKTVVSCSFKYKAFFNCKRAKGHVLKTKKPQVAGVLIHANLEGDV